MKKSKIFLIAAALLVFVSVFGAWTNVGDVEIRYADAPILATYATENVYYTRKEVVEEVYTPGECPTYKGLDDLSNECGAVAGAIIAGYYDKYYPNMVPNWTSYYTASGKYRAQDATYVPALIRQLYTLMRTNVDHAGVNETYFLNGLKTYINNNGYQVSFQNVKAGSSIDYAQCKNAINSNKVLALLVAPTNVFNFTLGSNYDTIQSYNIDGAHIMVVYGYYKVNYYNNSGLFRTDTYLRVSVGQNGAPKAYYRIDSTATQALYIVNIQ